jgi:hypothetical protein
VIYFTPAGLVMDMLEVEMQAGQAQAPEVPLEFSELFRTQCPVR